MAEPFNPYRVLGVRRAATEVEITKAYRRESKRHHPDRNPGDEDAAVKYAAVDRAYGLLLDPARRAAFDRDGDASDPRPRPAGDPAEAEILSVLGQFLLHAVQQAEANLYSKGVKHVDLTAKVRELVNEHLAAAEKAKASGDKGLAAMREAATRFSVDGDGPNHPATVLHGRIASLSREMAQVEADIQKFKRTLEYLKGVRYRKDSTGGSTGTTTSAVRMITSGTW